MKKQLKSKAAEDINTLYKIAKFGETIWRNSSTAFVEFFGEGSETVSFESVGVLKEYDILTSRLYSINKTMPDNYTKKELINELVNLLKTLRKEERLATKEDWDLLSISLLERPDQQVEIAVPIYGVVQQNNLVELGAFKIYKKESLIEKYPDIINSHSSIGNSDFFVSKTESAKSFEKCREKAEKNFLIFENVSNFITAGFHKTHKISIINNRSYEQLNHFAFANNQVLFGGKTVHRFVPVKIELPFYTDERNNLIWQLITSNRNGLQNKILESIEWAGMASTETDDNKALLLYLIAIESILNYSEKASLYVPITVSLADSVAFLLGKNKNSRKQYSKHIFDLYGLRSAIVHGNKGQEITDIDLHTAFSISHQIIRKILLEEPYKFFSNKKELSDYLLKEKKYELG